MPNKKLLAFLLLSASAAFTAVESFLCPDAATIQPCYCTESRGVSFVTCSHINNAEDLKNLARASDGYSYKEVIILNSSLPSIPKEVVEGIKMESVVFHNIGLNAFFDDPPKPNDTLKNITIEKLQVQEQFSWKYLQYTKGLENLFVRETPIPYITNQFNLFVSHTLKYVEFRKTETKEIQEDAFKEFRDLDMIAITDCKLKTLYRNCFPRPYNGRYLSFARNQLSTIDEDLFEDMKSVKFVDVSGNVISRIAQPSERGLLDNIEKINFLDNPIKCDCYLKWIPDLSSKEMFVGVCAAPKKLKGKPLKYLTNDDFTDC